MAATYPTLPDLVKSMNGVPTTNQWDIVCSYTVAQLNAFLTAQYQAGKLAKEIKLSTKRQDPLTGAIFTISYDIQFASPKLTFMTGRSGFGYLTMPINNGSSYSVTPDGAIKPTKTAPIPGGIYSVQATVPLAAIQGDTGSVIEQGQVVYFSDGKPEDNHVIIHFKNAKGTLYKILPEPDPKDKDVLVTYFLPVLDQYFQDDVSEVDYALASVNNTPAPVGQTALTPKSFAFASTGEGDAGVLSLYIQTKESGNPPGNPAPSFQPGDTATFPIPQGYTASLIFANDLITKTFITPQLTQNGFTTSYDSTNDGISAQLKKDGSVVAKSEHNNYIFSGSSYDGLNISLNDHPVNLIIKQGQMSLHWSAKTTSGWSTYASGGMSTVTQYGSVDLTLTMDKGPYPLVLTDNDITIAKVDVSSSDFKVNTSAGGCKWYEVIVGCSESVPSFYKGDMKLSIPSISVELHGLNFLCDTNLLAPGQHMIDMDDKKGVQTPHDFLIVGQVTAVKTNR
ncbi:MAG: hypothetical protein HQL73_09095 [Magnetococcales bacterium]|nr:hypothetical protein [Magnetococcales bacterium]